MVAVEECAHELCQALPVAAHRMPLQATLKNLHRQQHTGLSCDKVTLRFALAAEIGAHELYQGMPCPSPLAAALAYTCAVQRDMCCIPQDS